MPTMAETTTIEITVENWQWLNSLKRPSESFNDVLDRLRTQDRSDTAQTDESEPTTITTDMDLPGSGDTLQKRRATVARLYQHLQQQGTATKSDFLELVEPEEVNYSSAESFWSNCIKARDTLRTLPGVHPPNEGEHTWRYTQE
jgi:hypothetical protein